MKTIDLKEKYALINAQWTPHVVAELNGQQVKLAKIEGEFVWHAHDDEDEMFYVVQGALEMRFRENEKHWCSGHVFQIWKTCPLHPCFFFSSGRSQLPPPHQLIFATHLNFFIASLGV